ncbi:MAG: hypothetical protein FJ308_20615 [Planctomycetes bacterium]|nr:hypothetical protein [Planctomycetota bacterium]
MRRIRDARRFSSALLAFATIIFSNFALAQDFTSMGGWIFGNSTSKSDTGPKSDGGKVGTSASFKSLGLESDRGMSDMSDRFEVGSGIIEQDEVEGDWLAWIASKSKTSKKTSSSWLPTWGTPTKKVNSLTYSRNNKTTWQKFQQSSKQAWRKTADVLNPYPPPNPKSSKKSGNSWFSGWGESKDSKKIDSVPEWLGQESPK